MKLTKEIRSYLSAVLAFCIWGVGPLYFKLLNFVPLYELTIYRIWSTALASIFLICILKKFKGYSQIKKKTQNICILTLTGLLSIISWTTYAWGINTNRILDISLAYYLSPIVMILFSIIFLKEKLSKFQITSLVIASLGIGIRITDAKLLTVHALIIPICLGFYGLLKKKTRINPILGIGIETVLWSFPALAITLAYPQILTTQHLFADTPSLFFLILGVGFITLVPLALLSYSLQNLPYSSIAFLQYLNPTLNYLIAIFIYKEKFNSSTALSFLFIWFALAIYSFDIWKKSKKSQTI